MEATINRSDFAALDVIQMILRVSKNDMATTEDYSLDQLKWVVDMIRHEVEQTGRVEPVA
jgi:hypothetical protein